MTDAPFDAAYGGVRTNPDPAAIAAALLYREGLLLDRQDWEGWLALYRPDVVYWVPSWRNESELVENVRREVSLIYHPSRAGLEERVLRIRSRKSVTAMPLPRTVHLVSNVLVESATREAIEASASWVVHEYDPRAGKTHMNFGRYEFGLRQGADGWQFARKKIVLVNDLISTVLDFFNL